MDFISGIIQNSVAGFVDAATTSIGGTAGDLLIRAGDAIENVGQGYGDGVAGRFDNWGTAIKAYGGTPRPAGPSTKGVKATGGKPRPKTIARSNSTPTVAVKKGPSTTPRAALPSTTGTAARKTHSKPVQKRIASQPSQPLPSNIKYTPGVLTGMPKANTSTVKRASQPNKPKEPATKQNPGELKYTPGKLTGMPTKSGVKPSGPAKPSIPQVKPPSNKSDSNTNKSDSKDKSSKKLPGQRIDRTFF